MVLILQTQKFASKRGAPIFAPTPRALMQPKRTKTTFQNTSLSLYASLFPQVSARKFTRRAPAK